MDTCETCGNRYDRAFTMIVDGRKHIFDSLECAIHALAPACARCGCRVIGHGVQVSEVIFCGAHCAAAAGHAGTRDRA